MNRAVHEVGVGAWLAVTFLCGMLNGEETVPPSADAAPRTARVDHHRSIGRPASLTVGTYCRQWVSPASTTPAPILPDTTAGPQQQQTAAPTPAGVAHVKLVIHPDYAASVSARKLAAHIAAVLHSTSSDHQAQVKPQGPTTIEITVPKAYLQQPDQFAREVLAIAIARPAVVLRDGVTTLGPGEFLFDLRDGTRLVGHLQRLDVLPLDALFGRVEIPVNVVQDVERSDDAGAVQVRLNNGDVVTGTLVLEAIYLKTKYGLLAVPTTKITRIIGGDGGAIDTKGKKTDHGITSSPDTRDTPADQPPRPRRPPPVPPE